ncbi:restriction endonuclease subunit S [Phaeobacter sp. JH57H2]|uniref:restriction endonuclease subunit S n=1 Tax=unclassified Phaeobacter TaxID=2621772 RepID=UPI003A860A48
MKARWESKPISEFAKTSAGGTPKKSNKAFYEGGDVPWLLSGEVGQGEITTAKNFITKEGLAGSSAKVFPRDSVLVAMYGATAGNAGILRFPAATNQAVCAILPNSTYLPEYLYFYLLLAKQELIDQAVGNAQPNISQAKIKATEVPLPPLEEQKRIVAVLEQAFAALDRARTHAETNLTNANELFERVSAKLFDETTDGCEPRPLGEYAAFRNGLNFSQHSSGQEIRILGVGDFQNHFNVPFEGLKTVRMEGNLSQADHIQAGDIFAVRSNGNRELIGRVLLADKTDENASFSGFTIRIRINSSDLDPQYLCHYLKSADARKRLVAGGGGANISNLNQKILSNLTLGVPDHNRQQAFVVAMENLAQQTQKLTKVYRDKLSDIEDLRQSLLKKAFSGELT